MKFVEGNFFEQEINVEELLWGKSSLARAWAHFPPVVSHEDLQGTVVRSRHEVPRAWALFPPMIPRMFASLVVSLASFGSIIGSSRFCQ